jgi:hydroxymethylpyrimidine pyrophosphatase-like HAD family hydrolase
VLLPRVIATDLDGTLLRSDSTLSERTRSALRAARSAGIKVVVATARPARVIGTMFVPEDLDAAIVGNGAGRYDLATGALALTHPMSPSMTARVIEETARLLPGTSFGVETGHRFLHEATYHYRPSLDWERYPVADRADLCVQPVVKLLALISGRDPRAAWDTLRTSLTDAVECTWSAGHGAADRFYPTILELAAVGVTKAAALADLCAGWGIEPAEVCAFGDAPNDISMLEWAGTGCAVANAHPDVLALTPHRVPGNDEDGVAQFLESLLAQPSAIQAPRGLVDPG